MSVIGGNLSRQTIYCNIYNCGWQPRGDCGWCTLLLGGRCVRSSETTGPSDIHSVFTHIMYARCIPKHMCSLIIECKQNGLLLPIFIVL